MKQARPAGPAEVTGRRFRLASPATATVLGVLVVALVAASVVLAAVSRQLTILKRSAEPRFSVAVILALWLSFVVHQVRNWRRATGERRQQLKCLRAAPPSPSPWSPCRSPSRRPAWPARCWVSGWPPCRSASGSGSSSTACTTSTGSSPGRWPTRS